ncbi:MAG: adenosylmethionine decarboxylase [Firmicutes bacterium]|nr:adenosylmethionine decarboxylase [Bacillota bacterium]
MYDPCCRHLIAELYQCNPDLLDDLPFIEKILVDAALICKTEILEMVFHKYTPSGVSGVVIINGSHLALHTFPLHGYASLDIVTCGSGVNPNEAYHYITNHLQANCALVKELQRGFDELFEMIS